MTYYPIAGSMTLLHVVEFASTKTLCGATPRRLWEMSYNGEAFPEIGDFDAKQKAFLTEGFNIGRAFAPHYYFCKRCYNALKINRNIPSTSPA